MPASSQSASELMAVRRQEAELSGRLEGTLAFSPKRQRGVDELAAARAVEDKRVVVEAARNRQRGGDSGEVTPSRRK